MSKQSHSCKDFFKDRNRYRLILNVKSNIALIFRHLPGVSVNYSGYWKRFCTTSICADVKGLRASEVSRKPFSACRSLGSLMTLRS